MSRNREDFHELLVEILGSRNVYFQPPETVKMSYPAIVYSLSEIRNTFANDNVYGQKKSYDVTVIDKNPDSEIVGKVSVLPLCRFSRHYKSENLNHYTFTIFYRGGNSKWQDLLGTIQANIITKQV